MAETTINPLLLSLLSTLLVALMQPPCHIVTAKSDGLTLKLISRNSPESPFYQPNLTYGQRIQALAHQSIARAQYLKNMTTLASKKNQTLDPCTPETVRMIFNNFQDLASYHVRIGVGTFSADPQYKSYNLLVDTGSDLTWLQCDGCRTRHCFKSVDEPFPSSTSSTYKPLPCRNHPLCEADCDGEFCTFIRSYGDGHTNVQGVLASETFSFESSTGPPGSREFVRDLVFGCTMDNTGVAFDKNTNKLSGILGLGFGSRSFVTQLQSAGQSDGRFSYCFRREPEAGPTSSFLRFGADIEEKPDLSVTALRKYNDASLYYVNLLGISIMGGRLNSPPDVFAVQPDGTGGTIIDSGQPMTTLMKPAYGVLVKGIEAVFSAMGEATVRKIPSKFPPLEPCYEVVNKQAFAGYPWITFHFDNNADLNLEYGANFFVVENESGNIEFCLAILPELDNHGMNSIGALQQINSRFIYDTKGFKLFFGPENCFESS